MLQGSAGKRPSVKRKSISEHQENTLRCIVSCVLLFFKGTISSLTPLSQKQNKTNKTQISVGLLHCSGGVKRIHFYSSWLRLRPCNRREQARAVLEESDWEYHVGHNYEVEKASPIRLPEPRSPSSQPFTLSSVSDAP